MSVPLGVASEGGRRTKKACMESKPSSLDSAISAVRVCSFLVTMVPETVIGDMGGLVPPWRQSKPLPVQSARPLARRRMTEVYRGRLRTTSGRCYDCRCRVLSRYRRECRPKTPVIHEVLEWYRSGCFSDVEVRRALARWVTDLCGPTAGIWLAPGRTYSWY